MSRLLARLRVIATAAPTWLAVVALGAPLVAQELAEVLPAPWTHHVTAVVLTTGSVASAAIAVIRRLTPVVKAQRGLLPPQES